MSFRFFSRLPKPSHHTGIPGPFPPAPTGANYLRLETRAAAQAFRPSCSSMDGSASRGLVGTVVELSKPAPSFNGLCGGASPAPARGAPEQLRARSRVTVSTESPARRVALVSPSVTYGAEAAVLDHDRLPADRVGRRAPCSGGAAAAARRAAWAARERERLLERDREQLLLGLERPGCPCPSSGTARSGRSRGDLRRRRPGRRRPSAAGTAAAARRRA